MLVAHADWGAAPGSRQLAVARLEPGPRPGQGRYRVISVAPPPEPDRLLGTLAKLSAGQAVIGFDFPIGLPRRYADLIDVSSFPPFLQGICSEEWREFAVVARHPGEISLRRPFYPAVPGGTRREHLYAGLGIDAAGLRRRCDGTDAEILFWTLGSKQVGKGALTGWKLLAAARDGGSGPAVALWPFDGRLPELLDGSHRVIAAEAYPREFYQYMTPAGMAGRRWSKRRRADRMALAPGLLGWAKSLGVTWRRDIASRARDGFGDRRGGEDEFDAVVGLLGVIGVVTGAIGSGEPGDDPAVTAVEGWILGRNLPGRAAPRAISQHPITSPQG